MAFSKQHFVAAAAVFVALMMTSAAFAQLPPAYQLWKDKGRTWKTNFGGYFGEGFEYYVRDGMSQLSGYTYFEWDRQADWLDLHVVIEGINARPNLCLDFNPSNAYNEWPTCVHNGNWRLLFVHHVNAVPVEYYYDPVTGTLRGTEFDYYGNYHTEAEIKANATVVIGYGHPMILTEPLDIRRGDSVNQVIRFSYSAIRNWLGKTGIMDSKANLTLGDAGSLVNLYSRQLFQAKPLPSYSWDNILDNLLGGGSLVTVLTYMPRNEPDNLKGRDNIMLGPQTMLSFAAAGIPGVYDTPTCWALKHHLPRPFDSDVQINGAWYSDMYCPVTTYNA